MTTITGFQRVASAYDPTEVLLAVALLQGAGFVVLTPGLPLNQVASHYSIAYGPVAIFVPEADADDARALLHAAQSDTLEVAGPAETSGAVEASEPRKQRALRRKLLDLAGFVISGISHPRDRLSIDGSRREARAKRSD